MNSRRDIAAMLTTTFVTWMGQRTAAVALPLVALAETGSAWSTGLVGGAVGLPLLASPWWAKGLRQRLTTGRALACVLAVQVVGLLVVPIGAAVATVTVVHLAAAGLITGCGTALSGPGQRALLSDICDNLGSTLATKMLAWQDFLHRITMILAPPVAGAAVATGGPLPLLWAEAAGVSVGAALLLTVRGTATAASPDRPDNTPALRQVLAQHGDIRCAVTMSGVGGLVWFAFTLGLAILGAETGRPGLLISAGMTGYGIGSLAGALLAPMLVPRLPALATMATGWIVLGVAFMALPAVTSSLVLLGCVAAVGGFSMPLGIGALNRLISTRTAGAQRRAAFAAESLVHDGAVSIGLLAGGAVIGVVGAGPTLVTAGAAQIIAALLAGPWLRTRRRPRDLRRSPAEITAASAGLAESATDRGVAWFQTVSKIAINASSRPHGCTSSAALCADCAHASGSRASSRSATASLVGRPCASRACSPSWTWTTTLSRKPGSARASTSYTAR
ncbi:MFS transporter [Micromonospora sp. WMMD812]|uniref:MFS transporter n=1 Tax=Micromonospora sp. WMMD812 TaxID=3015152 RepID=UPI00248B2863|nr:MFS transporter [Micromonospora sp. WMMD812]WBB69146.1 MFS transporter [Micromonospora sp. WMMD812]